MATYFQYSPDQVIITVGVKPVVGWRSVEVAFAEDRRTLHMSIHGGGRHVKNLSTNGTVTLELEDFSPSNADLVILDKMDLPVIVSVIDKSSLASVFVTDSAMISKIPPLNRGAEGGVNTWELTFVEGKLLHGVAKPV